MERKVEIVIADDNPNICQTLTDILVEEGYRVHAVRNGYELLSYLKSSGRTPEVIILDLIMPEKDGLDIFDSIKSIAPDVRIVIYTGYQKYEKSIYAKTADRFLLKDSPPKKLLEALKELVVS